MSKQRCYEYEDSKCSINNSTSSNELAGDETSLFGSITNVTRASAIEEVDSDTFDDRVSCVNSFYNFNTCFMM